MEAPWPRGRKGERGRMGSVEEEDEGNVNILKEKNLMGKI